MQDKMNELLKRHYKCKILEELNQRKEDFLKFELEFENIKNYFQKKDKNDFVDIFISDIHENKIISTKLEFYLKMRKQIENVFDEIYKLQEIKIELITKILI